MRGLIRSHIRKQIEYRINSMDKVCFDNGSCKMCGCQTTHLQMADKACAGNCYPRMKTSWKEWGEDLHHRCTLKDDDEQEEFGFEIDIYQEKFIKQ